MDDAPANIQIVDSILKDFYKIHIANDRREGIGTGKSYTSALI